MKTDVLRRSCVIIASASLFAGSLSASDLPKPSTSVDAAAQQTDAPVLSRAARGTTGTLEISYALAPLRAKATSDLSAPLLVRVSEQAPTRYRIEYMGLVSGSYDLAPYLEQTDGRTAKFATPITIEIFTQLPPNHGTDVFGLSAPSFGIRGHYRTFLLAAGAIWILVPIAILALRLARRTPTPTPTPVLREPSLSERLFVIVDEARTREISVDERGRLELLLLQTLRTAMGTACASPAALAEATASLRGDPTHGPVLRAVERWLHAENAGEAQRALASLDALRATHTTHDPARQHEASPSSEITR